MKITIESTKLLSALKIAGKLINSSKANFALTCFLFNVTERSMTITGGCDCGYITTSVDCEVDDIILTSFMLSSQELISALLKLPIQPLSILIQPAENESFDAIFSHSNGEFRISVGNALEYPSVISVTPNEFTVLNSDILLEGIKGVYPMAGFDELRPQSSGIYVDQMEDAITFVSIAKGSSAFMMVSKNENFNKVFNLHVPKVVSKCLLDTLPQKDSIDVSIGKSGNASLISFSNITISFLLIEGRYPNYKSIVPQNTTVNISLNNESFTRAIERVALFSSHRSIKLSIDDGTLNVYSEDPTLRSSASESVGIESEIVDRFDILINFEHAKTALSLLSSTSVKLQFSDSTSPFIVKCNNNEDGYDRVCVMAPYF